RSLNTCLEIACRNDGSPGQARLVELLLASGASLRDVARKDDLVQLAVYALDTSDLERADETRRVVRVLQEYGAPVDVYSAVMLGDEWLARRLLATVPEAANSLGPDGLPVLHAAVRKGDQKIVQAILDAGGYVEVRNQSRSTGTRGDTPLHWAAFWRRHDIARLLIKAGADVNAVSNRGETP